MSRRPMRRAAAIAPIALAALGCSTAQRVDYTPAASLSVPAAKFHIQRMIEEDPEQSAAAEVEVSDTRIAVTRQRVFRRVLPGVGAVARLPSVSRIDFADIGRSVLYAGDGVYWVHIFDDSGEPWMKVFSHQRGQLERLLDSFAVMISSQADVAAPRRAAP